MRWLSDAGLYSPTRRESELLSVLDSLSSFNDANDDFEEAPNQDLSKLVETEALRLDRHEFLDYLRSLYQHLYTLLSNGSERSLLIAVHAIDQLIDVQLLRQESAKVLKLVEFLSTALERLLTVETHRRNDLLCLICQTFGRLVKSGGAITAQRASKQIEEMLELLEEGSFQSCIALKMLTELAKNAPAQFNLHLDKFISRSHHFLFQEDDSIRSYTLKAIKACLGVVKQRASGKRQRWYQDRTQQLMNVVLNGSNLDKQQALMALHLFIKHSAGNLLASFPEIADLVFSLTGNQQDVLQELIVEIIPSLAAMCPQNFYSMYLNQAMELLINHLRNQCYQNSVLVSIPDLIQSLVHLGRGESPTERSRFRVQELAIEISRILSEQDISSMDLVHTGMKSVGYLAVILYDDWRSCNQELLPLILKYPVVPEQIEALKNIVEAYPETLFSIQDHFLNFVESTLTSQTNSILNLMKISSSVGLDLDQKMLVWNILSTFHFEIPIETLRLINASLEAHLSDQEHPALRLMCAKALENILSRLTVQNSRSFEDSSELIEAFLDHLTTTAVLDVSCKIRFELISDFLLSVDLQERLSQDKTVLRLSYGLYDESFPLRQSCIQLLGVLSRFNFGAVHPPLHGLLLKIIQDFRFTGDLATTSKLTQESAMLLQSLLRSEPRVVEIYLTQMIEILVSKLESYIHQTVMSATSIKDPSSEAVSSLILCLLEVASSSSETPFIEHHLRSISAILRSLMKDQSDRKMQFLAIKSITKLSEKFKESFVNFLVLPEILSTLQEVKSETNHTSNEGTTYDETEIIDSAVFTLAEWDPALLRLVSASPRTEISPPDQNEASLSLLSGPNSSFAFPTDEAVIGDEEYFNSEAINALMTALEDLRNTDSVLIVKSITSILQMLPKQGAFYLQKIIPVLAKVIRQSDEKLRILLFVHLTDLVRIVGDHVSPFSDILMKLCFQFWSLSPELTVHSLNLISELIRTLESSFENYFHDLVPRLCQILTNPGDFQLLEPVFELLQSSEKQIGPYFPVLFPLLLQFVQRVPTNEDPIPLPIQREVLKTLRCLLLQMHLKTEEKHLFASELFLTLIGLMKEEKSLLSDSKETLVVTMVVLGPQVSRVFARQIERVNNEDKSEEKVESGLLERALERLKETELEQEGVFTSEEIEALTPITPRVQSGPLLDSEVFPLDIVQLARSWDASDRSTKEDWEEWIRSLSVEFLRQSSSPALRACYSLAQVNPAIARSLFKFSLLSVWSRLDEEYRVQFQELLEMVLMTPALPLDVVQPIVDLGEYLSFIEQQEMAVSEDLRPLNGLAEKCGTFSKAVHFRMHR